jgi:folate-binding Fe-S cluster repair protein YgfZ
MVAMPENGARLFHNEKEVGYIGTVALHYELGPIALAVIKRNTPTDLPLIVDGVAAVVSQEFNSIN